MFDRILLLTLLAACTRLPDAPAPVPGTIRVDDELRFEIARYAGRMTAMAWIDNEKNLLFRVRLNRPTFSLPVKFDKAEQAYKDALSRTRSEEEAARLFVENRNLIDTDYGFEIETEFEKFWKTGPFATPTNADTRFAVAERIATPGKHKLVVALEPDTVSWSATLRLVKGEKVLWSVDFDSERHSSTAREGRATAEVALRR